MTQATLALIALATVYGCAAETRPTVTIETPADGAVITADSLPVTLSASGIDIVAADGEPTPGRAHHHLFLDVDLTPAGEAIPGWRPGVTHMGTGASSFTLKGLTPGRHRLIAVLALGDHVPLEPWAVDTVHFTVQAGGG